MDCPGQSSDSSSEQANIFVTDKCGYGQLDRTFSLKITMNDVM